MILRVALTGQNGENQIEGRHDPSLVFVYALRCMVALVEDGTPQSP